MLFGRLQAAVAAASDQLTPGRNNEIVPSYWHREEKLYVMGS